jgi:hypothetical protein
MKCSRRVSARVVVPDHVVFAKVAAGCDRDQRHRQATGVFKAVRLAEGDVDGVSLADEAGADAHGDLGGALHDDPMFRAVQVGLERGGGAWIETKGADAEARAFGEDGGGTRDGIGLSEGHRCLGKACVMRSVHDPVPVFHAPRLVGKSLPEG